MERGIGERRDGERQVRITLLIGAIAFGVALAIVLGNKMSNTAASVLTGVIAGIAASVPTSFVLVALMRGRERSGRDESVARAMNYPVVERGETIYRGGSGAAPRWRGGETMFSQPPVVVVTPTGGYGGQATYQGRSTVYPSPMPVLTTAPREFQLIGEVGYYGEEGFGT